MTPEQERAWRAGGDNRIGDPTREKWTAFLSRALEQGYLTGEEFTRRMEGVQSASTMDNVSDAIHIGEFSHKDLDAWNDHWRKKRQEGLESSNLLVSPEKAVAIPGGFRIPVFATAFSAGFMLVSAIIDILLLAGVRL